MFTTPAATEHARGWQREMLTQLPQLRPDACPAWTVNANGQVGPEMPDATVSTFPDRRRRKMMNDNHGDGTCCPVGSRCMVIICWGRCSALRHQYRGT